MSIWLAGTLVAAVAFALACIGSGLIDARGVDPHWYLADTETLANGDSARGHTVFAGLVARGLADTDHPARFLHNGPLLHIQGWLARHTEPIAAWRLTNGVLLVATALLVGATAATLVGPTAGGIATLLYLLAPLSVWQAANLYRETALAAITALAMWLIVRHFNCAAARIALGLSLAAAHAVHPGFGVAALTVALVVAWRRRWSECGTIVAALAAVAWLDAALFPSDFPPTLLDIARSSVPGGSNMLWQLAGTLPTLEIGLFVERAVAAFDGQFLTVRYLPFTLLANAGLVATVVLYRKQRSPRVPGSVSAPDLTVTTGTPSLAQASESHTSRLLAVACVAYLLFAAMSMLLQYLPRYLTLIAPVSTVLVVVAVARLRPRRRRVGAALALIVAGSVALDVYLMQWLRHEIETTRADQQALLAALGPQPIDSRIAMIGRDATERFVPLIAALAPRTTLLADSQLIAPAMLARIIDDFAPDLVIGDRVSLAGETEPLSMPGGEALYVQTHRIRER